MLRIETARVLDRLRVTGSLDDATCAAKLAAADSLLGTFHLMPLAEEMVDLAREKYAVEVSAVCAIHVATAQSMLWAGADDFIPRPFTSAEFTLRVRRLASRTRSLRRALAYSRFLERRTGFA